MSLMLWPAGPYLLGKDYEVTCTCMYYKTKREENDFTISCSTFQTKTWRFGSILKEFDKKDSQIICGTTLLVVSRPYSRIETKKSIDLLINFIDHIQEYLFSNVDSIFTKDMRK